ncbi:MAG: NfeD family protein [Planctomycetaceae bacterium]
MNPMVWSIVLLFLGLCILVVELFIPSSGLLGLLSALCLIGAIVLGFSSSQMMGTVMLALELIIVPIALGLAVKYWPHTPIGKMTLIPRPEHPDDVLPETEAYRGLNELVGRYGISKTLMMPGGVISLEGKSYDAVSDGPAIDPGQRVVVVGVSTQRLIVRQEEPELSESISSEPAPEATAPPSSPKTLPFEDPFV